MKFAHTIGLAAGLILAACGSQQQSKATANDSAAEVLPAPSSRPVATGTSVPSPGAAAANHNQAQNYTYDATNQTGARALQRVLVAAGTFDGQPITDVKLSDRCDMAFTTAAGTTVIDFRKVGNFAGRDEGKRWAVDIDDGKGSHTISVPGGTQPDPVGDASWRVDSGFGVIADSCQS